MSKRFLILCQRKSSTLANDKDDVEQTVDAINTYVGANFGEDVDIEYLTTHEQHPGGRANISNYSADYKFALNDNSEAKQFVENNAGMYDGIILNTCAVNYMNYDMIAKLLKSGGFLLIKTFAPEDTDGEKNLKKVAFLPITLKNIKQFFTQQNGYGSHYYIKKEQAGKKNKKQKTKNKNTKNKIKMRNIKRIRTMKTIKRRS
jgi:hypothetical protein